MTTKRKRKPNDAPDSVPALATSRAAITQQPRTAPGRAREAHDAIVPQEMQWETVYLPLRKPMAMHEGWILHCDAHWKNFCMIERPKNPPTK